MLRTRVIPVLLLKNGGLYKGKKFKNHKYVGDPINTVKIFNEKQVDEIVLLDIEASKNNTPINFQLIEEISGEAFMPIAYGGGIKTLEDAKKIFGLGIEKIVLNTYAIKKPELVKELVKNFGSQSVVFSLDVRPDFFNKMCLYIKSGTIKVKENIVEIALKMQEQGVGEIILNCMDLEGTGRGYNLRLIRKLTEILEIPLIAAGGAANINHMIEAKKSGAHGIAAGTMFVFQGSLKGVLITYLNENELNYINQ
ncbi:AglZ/HisF2 family acetamidino modification protein [Flavobacteriaceae bacterium]|nr:AglZ/HisF2 family acetamidino modification protein [Flavobacteriaceae bacterium]